MEQNQNQNQNQISAEQALQMQFAKVGQLTFQIEIMQQQMSAMEQELKSFRENKDEVRDISGTPGDNISK